MAKIKQVPFERKNSTMPFKFHQIVGFVMRQLIIEVKKHINDTKNLEKVIDHERLGSMERMVVKVK